MAEYGIIVGVVQQFPNQDGVFTERQLNGETVRDICLKTVGDHLVRVTVFAKHAHFTAKKGDLVWADGKKTTNGKFNNMDAQSIGSISACETNQAIREVVNSRADSF